MKSAGTVGAFRKDLILFFLICTIVGGSTLFLGYKKGGNNFKGFWEILNAKCVGCGGCAVECVLPTSAAKAQMNDSICDHLDACPAFYKKVKGNFSRGRENQICPVDAIIRTDIGDGKFSYSIDKEKCIGCGKCTKACQRKGEGALQLVIDKELCLDCNECNIATTCPKDAVIRLDNKDDEEGEIKK